MGAIPAVCSHGAVVISGTKMSYLKAVPRTSDVEPPARAVTVVSPEARETVYLDETASLEIITEALKAWGLRVRAERGAQPAEASAPPPATADDSTWQTTRPDHRAPSRLENNLSPLWLPIRSDDRSSDPSAAWAWFGRAA